MTRALDVIRKVVVPLAEIQHLIPRNKGGDPAFTRLINEFNEDPPEGTPPSVLMVFSPEQVVAIVNRWLYQAEYQQIVHRKRAEEQRKQQKPVKEAFKRLYPSTSFINATPEQIEAAIKAAAEREKDDSK